MKVSLKDMGVDYDLPFHCDDDELYANSMIERM